jgi:hypothetical protein
MPKILILLNAFLIIIYSLDYFIELLEMDFWLKIFTKKLINNSKILIKIILKKLINLLTALVISNKFNKQNYL